MEDEDKIISLHEQGKSVRGIAKEIGRISKSSVQRIIKAYKKNEEEGKEERSEEREENNQEESKKSTEDDIPNFDEEESNWVFWIWVAAILCIIGAFIYYCMKGKRTA